MIANKKEEKNVKRVWTRQNELCSSVRLATMLQTRGGGGKQADDERGAFGYGYWYDGTYKVLETSQVHANIHVIPCNVSCNHPCPNKSRVSLSTDESWRNPVWSRTDRREEIFIKRRWILQMEELNRGRDERYCWVLPWRTPREIASHPLVGGGGIRNGTMMTHLPFFQAVLLNIAEKISENCQDIYLYAKSGHEKVLKVECWCGGH